VVIQMPRRELRRGDPAGNRVGQAEQPFGDRVRPGEDVVMQHLVQEHREVEHREALHERKRNPDVRRVETHETPRRQAQDKELAHANHEMADGRLDVQPAQRLPVERAAQLSPQRNGVVGIEAHISL
jgi:hypothetical protein